MLRFTIDEWMAVLFFPDAPQPLGFEWALERLIRRENQILSLCRQLAPTGLDVIFDFVFFDREQRQRVREAAQGMGPQTRLHYLPAPADLRWERVARRNADKGLTFEIEMTRGMFDFCENLFEAPTAEELEGAVVIE